MQRIGFRRKFLPFMQDKRRGDRQWPTAALLRADENARRSAILARLDRHQIYRRARIERREYDWQRFRLMDDDQKAAARQ